MSKPHPQKQRKPKRTPSLGLPSEQEILDFIATSPGIVGKRDIAKAFGLHGNAKIGLKALLKDLEDKGTLGRKGKKMSSTATLPPVTILEISHIDDQGHAIALPAEWNGEAHGEPPSIILRHEHGMAAPGVGDRVLARIEALPHGKQHQYQARVMRPLSREALRVVGIYRAGPGNHGRIIPSGKKDRYDYHVPHGDDGGAADGELVSAEVTKPAARGLPQARVRVRLGTANDPRNTSLIAIHTHGIPDQFPAAVMDEVTGLEAVPPAGPRRPARCAAAHHRSHRCPRPRRRRMGRRRTVTRRTPAASRSSSPLPMWLPMCARKQRLTAKPANAATPPISPTAWYPCCRSGFPTTCARCAKAKTALPWPATWSLTGTARSCRITSPAPSCAPPPSSPMKRRRPPLMAVAGPRPMRCSTRALKPLWAAYAVLSRARDKRGPLELDLPEKKIILDDKGNIARVVVPERLDAHRLIEEFMIQANVAAAEELNKTPHAAALPCPR